MKNKDIFKLMEFLYEFQKIERTQLVAGTNRDENDIEHSFQLAMLAWYIVDSQKLEYDLEKILKYSLVHDLVETYAGDTYFTTDPNKLEEKEKKEKAALKRIEEEFKEFPDMINWIEKYEEREDQESQFIYALDKMIPVLSIYLDKGRSWHRDEVTFEMIRNKDNKIQINEDIMEIWMSFMELVEEDKDNLFPKHIK